MVGTVVVGKVVDASMLRTRRGAVALVVAAVLGTATGATTEVGVADTPGGAAVSPVVTAPRVAATRVPTPPVAATGGAAVTEPVVVLQAVPPPATHTVVVTLPREPAHTVTVTAEPAAAPEPSATEPPAPEPSGSHGGRDEGDGSGDDEEPAPPETPGADGNA